MSKFSSQSPYDGLKRIYGGNFEELSRTTVLFVREGVLLGIWGNTSQIILDLAIFSGLPTKTLTLNQHAQILSGTSVEAFMDVPSKSCFEKSLWSEGHSAKHL